MVTFNGSYLREPSDFSTVATEAALIQIADDPQLPTVSSGVLAWADLTPTEEAALVATLNPIIVSKEGVIDGYLRSGGYVTPTDVALNPSVKEWAAKLVWNTLRFRKEQITDEQLETLDNMILKLLRDVASGVLLLVGVDSAVEPASGTVYAIGTSPRIMSRETLEEM